MSFNLLILLAAISLQQFNIPKPRWMCQRGPWCKHGADGQEYMKPVY